MLKIEYTSKYKRDRDLAASQGCDISLLDSVVDLLASEHQLPARCKDHPLKGNLVGTRECHITGDWVLVYAKDKTHLVLKLLQTGTHSRILGR